LHDCVIHREALLESAITSLQEKGYAATTARDVADGAGVSLGAIGYHFGTMKELLYTALAEAVRRWFDPLVGLLSRPQPPLTFEQLGPTLDGLLDTLAGHRPLVIAYLEALLRAERSPPISTRSVTRSHAGSRASSLVSPSLCCPILRLPPASPWQPPMV
jgi:AcrR family transcriptional regulator